MTWTITLEDGPDPIEATCEAFVADNACTMICRKPAVALAPYRGFGVDGDTVWEPVCADHAGFDYRPMNRGVGWERPKIEGRPLPKKQVLVARETRYALTEKREFEETEGLVLRADSPEALCQELEQNMRRTEIRLLLGVEIERVWNTRRRG